MKRMTLVLVLTAALLLMAGLSGCTQAAEQTASPTPGTTTQQEATQAPQETTAATEPPADPVTITLLMSGDNTPSATNAVLDAILERTNINLLVTYVPTSDYNTKLSAMLASGKLTDLISYSIADGEEFRDADIILELTDLLNEYGTNVLADQGENLYTGLNTKDEVWGLYSGFSAPTNLAIRTDWLDAVGMDMPTDLDSLYDVLKAFTNDDPDGDGEKNTIGIGAFGTTGFYYIFGAFGIPMNRNIQLEDGTVTTYMRHPMYLDAIRYIRTLYQEGLMEPEFVTIPAMSCYEKLWTGIYGTFDFGAGGTTNNWLGRYTEDPIPTFDFAVIAGPGGAGGTPPVHYGTYLGITSGCEHPDSAMSLINYLVTKEGNELLRLGIEGVHFNWIDETNGEKEWISPYDDSAVNRNDGVFVYWGPFAARNLDNNAAMREYNAQTREGIKLASQYPIADAYIFSALEVDKEYGDTLNAIVKEAFAQLIVSTGDIEAEYEEFVNRWLVEGGEAWEEEATRVYAEENS